MSIESIFGVRGGVKFRDKADLKKNLYENLGNQCPAVWSLFVAHIFLIDIIDDLHLNVCD